MTNKVDVVRVTGTLNVVLEDETGKIMEEYTVPNLITSAGKSWITGRMLGTTEPAMSHIAIGSSSAAPDVSDTALDVELARVAFTSSIATSENIVYKAVFGIGVGTGLVEEAGLFNSDIGGIMCARTLVAETKSANSSLILTWTITLN